MWTAGDSAALLALCLVCSVKRQCVRIHRIQLGMTPRGRSSDKLNFVVGLADLVAALVSTWCPPRPKIESKAAK